MSYVDRIKPEEYQALVAAFGQVGAPIFARVGLLINKQRVAAGNPKRIAQATLKKAWDQGWPELVGGGAAPAIKTLFPNMTREIKPVEELEIETVIAEQDQSRDVSKLTVSEAGATSAAGVLTREVKNDAPHHAEHAEGDQHEMVNAMITRPSADTAAQAVQPIDPMIAAWEKLDKGRIAALLNEATILGAARANIKNLEDLVASLLGALAGRKDIVERLVKDLSTSDAVTLRTYRETLREVVATVKDMHLAFKLVQESQRLLVGMPQRITEDRGGKDEGDAAERVLGRFADMLRTRLDNDDARTYAGEETAGVIDVEFAPGSKETEPDRGEDVAKNENEQT